MNEIKKFNDVMLDLETMGNKSNAAIVSIGAVEFNIDTGETGREFYEKIDLQSCIDLGFKIDASTLYWWMKQNEKARIELSNGGDHISLVLHKFLDWFHVNSNYNIWGNGSRFDIGILEDAFFKCDYVKVPWNFRNERDLRTIVALMPDIKTKVLNENKDKIIEHHPIDDCKIQIDYLCKIWKMIILNNK